MGQPELFIILYSPILCHYRPAAAHSQKYSMYKNENTSLADRCRSLLPNKISFKGHRNRVDDYQNMLAESYSPINRDRYELKIAYYFDVINVGNDPRDLNCPTQSGHLPMELFIGASHQLQFNQVNINIKPKTMKNTPP